METMKARSRRILDGFFIKYISGLGIDIGAGDDPLTLECDKWDFIDGYDSRNISYIESEKYNWIYSSYTLENLTEPSITLREWWRILKDGGYLILYVPHRDLYEHRRTLPSCGNANHKWYFLIDRNEEPCTLGIIPMIRNLTNYDIEYVKKCDNGYSCKFINNEHVSGGVQPLITGESSIEAVIHKGYNPIFIDQHN